MALWRFLVNQISSGFRLYLSAANNSLLLRRQVLAICTVNRVATKKGHTNPPCPSVFFSPPRRVSPRWNVRHIFLCKVFACHLNISMFRWQAKTLPCHICHTHYMKVGLLVGFWFLSSHESVQIIPTGISDCVIVFTFFILFLFNRKKLQFF